MDIQSQSSVEAGSINASQVDHGSVEKTDWPHWLGWVRSVHPVLLATLVLGILVWVGFGHSRDYTWLKFDTEKYILEDRAIRALDWEHISSIFSTYYFINYNPLHRLSYSIDYALWGFDPGGFRSTNFILHWIAGVFVFVCFYKLTRRLTPAWLTSICFMIHPTRVENVVWLAQRKDVLSSAFGFASIWMYLNVWRDNCLQHQSETLPGSEEASSPAFNSLWFMGSLFLYACALASKAQWVPLCGILILIDLYQRRKFTWKVWMGYVPFFLLSVVFAWYAIDSQLLVGKKGAFSSITLIERLSKPLLGLGFYLWRTLWPVNMCPRYPEHLRFEPALICLGAAAVVVGGIGLIWSWRHQKEFFFGAVWFLFFLSPMLNLLPGNLVVADRYLYVAIVGLMLPIGLKLSQYRVAIGLAAIAIVTVLQLWLTLAYVPKWQDNFTLWHHSVSVSPDNIFALTALGQSQIQRKEYAAARNSLDQAEALGQCFAPIYLTCAQEEKNIGKDVRVMLDQARLRCPDLPELMAAYGYYWELKQNDLEAEKWFVESLRRRSTIEILKSLGGIYERLNEPDKGLEVTFRGLQNYPFDEECWLMLGRFLEMKGNLKQAEEAFQQVAHLAPEVTEAHYRLASLAYQRGDSVAAHNSLQTMYLNLNGKQMPAPASNLWAAVYRQRKQYILAIAKLTEAVQQEASPQYWLNLAKLQFEAGYDPQLAIKKAISLDPSYQAKVAQDAQLGPLLSPNPQKVISRP